LKPKLSRLALVVCLSLTLGLSAQTGVITTIAGTATRGYGGDDAPSLSASIALANLQNKCDPNRYEQTVHLSFDTSGKLYFADSDNQRIRQITAAQNITTVVGNGSRPSINSFCESIGSVGDGNDPRSALLYNPSDVFAAPNGNLIIADQQNNRIRLVTPQGKISTIAGNGTHNFYAPGIPATSSPMDWPSAVIADSSGVIYFAEIHGNRVGKIGLDQKLATVAGTGFPGYNGDQIQANTAQLRKPAGIALDRAGNLYIADQGNHRIRMVAPNGIISTIAGTGKPDFSGDGGPAAAAALNTPMDVKLDSQGNIYIADMLNQRVRRIDTNGNITTVAGDGQPGRGPDGVPATSSSLNFPAGLAVDKNDDLYIIDWQNYLIRKASFSSRPAIAAGAVVSAASFTAPVAPGGLISIFGRNLATSTVVASEVPWPTVLAGTSVKVNGIGAPLYFVSDTQINAQLPFETAAGGASVTVTNSFGVSDPVPFNVAPAAAGIFVYPGTNRAIAQNQDGTLNAAANPEAPGRVIVAYLTGQGAVSPAVPTGQPAPLDVLSMASQPFSATIGAVDAPVLFLGLVPGYIGLAQANILIPSGAPTGDVVLIVIVGGQPGNTAVISVH
jgi:uncharacterized protein (TIGR03437 family)